MTSKRIVRWGALAVIALMLSALVLSAGVSIVAATPSEEVRIENMAVYKKYESGGLQQWRFTYNGQSIPAIEGDRMVSLVAFVADTGATSEADAKTRSRIRIDFIQNNEAIYTYQSTPSEHVVFWSTDVNAWVTYYSYGNQDPTFDYATTASTTVQTAVEVYEGGYWITNEVWTNTIGEAQPLPADDQLTSVQLDFTFGTQSVADGSTVVVKENGTLSGVTASAVITNGYVPAPTQLRESSYIDVSLLDADGKRVYSDIIWEGNKQQMSNGYWSVTFEGIDIVSDLLRFNDAYTIRIDLYALDASYNQFVKYDTWTVYLDNQWANIPPEDPIGASIYGTLGFIGVIGFVASPMLMAAVMRRGMESYRAIPLLLMLMVASGVLAYVFLLGGD